MEYRILINGCSETYKAQAEELNSCCAAFLSSADHGKTIILHDGSIDTDELVSKSPTPEIQLLQIRRYQPETVLELLEKTEARETADLYLFYGDFAGNELSVRFAHRKTGSVLTGVNQIKVEKSALFCRKPVYSSHMHAVLEMKKKPWCISLAKGAVEPLPVDGRGRKEVHKAGFEATVHADAEAEAEDEAVAGAAAEADAGQSWILSEEFTEEEKTQELEQAAFILAAGRGAGSEQACKRIEKASAYLKADFGASRLAAMNGWTPLNRMIGISGAVVRANLCIALGVSGAAAFMAGVDKSEFIAAVNTDPKAPIVKLADVTVIEDAVPFIEALEEVIQEDFQEVSQDNAQEDGAQEGIQEDGG
ncbi:MAG: electron transfer flavoprotein subunit alpha/FixB family protein [Spirochaetales bacterium]|nr:electron transfer flavoprotein subunit alpha/FixB family protein [Spirochaetales bacterium]